MGLTASRQDDLCGLEKNLLENYRFKFFDSLLDVTPLDVNRIEATNIKKFFDATYDDMARLIYVDAKQVKDIEDQAKQRDKLVRIKVSSLEELRTLEPNHVLIVTEKRLMRGFDYKCEAGIQMLLAKQADSAKSLK